jgi:hypothetical protein
LEVVKTALIAILVFGFLIFIHEFGHYIFARIFKVTITEFSLGMGPKLLWYDSKKTGIRYCLSAIPFGGYVAMVGEDSESDDPNAFNKKPAWQRLIITVAGATVNIVVGIILVVSLLRKLRLDYVRYIALGAGGVLGMVCLIMGKAVDSLQGSLIVMLLWGLLTILGIALLEFLNLTLHYKAAQDLEFEDEEYFYQVRAIPKINPVSKTKKQVKTINEVTEEIPVVEKPKKTEENKNGKNISFKGMGRKRSKDEAVDELFKDLRK